MRILHVDPERSFGGGERQVAGLVAHLARRGHENHLAAPPGSALVERIPGTDVRWIPLSIRNDLDLRAAWRLRRIARDLDPDVIHLHTGRSHAMSPWLAPWRERIVVTRRMDYRVRSRLRADWLFNRSVARVVAISEDVRRRLVEGGVEPGRIHVIPSAIDPPGGLPGPAGRRAARERFGAGDELVFAVVAALEHRKGHDVLIEALRGIDVPWTALFCGDGSRRSALEHQAEAVGIEDRIRFLGERRQVADVLAAADVFVLPSRHEGLGVAILEAMSMALPVIASRVGGIPEVVVEGETGLLVPAEDPRALADAIATLASDRTRAGQMGTRGRERVLSRFSMSALADRYEEIYAGIARRVETRPTVR